MACAPIGVGRLFFGAALTILVAPVAAADSSVAEENGVLVLDERSFDETIKGNPFILVMFYAPWCGHCKQFAPEYAGAAKQLRVAKPPVPLAKVDATVETKLAEKYGVRGYPTLRLFVDGRDQEYTGGRTEQSLVTWVLKKAGPPAIVLEDTAAAEQFERENPTAVLGFFEQGSSHGEVFESAARQLEDLMFATSTSPQVAARYGLTPPAIRMLYPHDEKVADFKGDLGKAAEIETFAKAYRHPAVGKFDGETAPELFGDGRPILFLFRERDEAGDAAEKVLREAARSLQRRLLVSIAGASEPMDQRLMDYVAVEPEELPTVRLIADAMSAMTKYKLEGEITAASITAFVGQYESGRLRPHLKSEESPASQPGPIHTLVGKTFEQVVKDPEKDVLVEFYAPWCGHCKKLEPIFKEVAKRLESVGTLIVAKMDSTANDAEGVDVEGFPSIMLWRGGKDKKDAPLEYDGDRDVESFVAWLEEKVTYRFNRDELKNEL